MTFNSQDFNAYWIPEDTFGTVPDAGTLEWKPFIEVASISGRGTTQEVKEVKRLGTRKRAGSPRGKIDEDTLSIELYMTDNLAVTGGASMSVDVFDGWFNKPNETFDHTYNKATGDSAAHADDAGIIPPSYSILVQDDSDGTGSVFEYYYGCVLSEIEVNISEGEVVMVTLNFERKGSLLTAVEKSGGTHNYGTYPPAVDYVLWSGVTITKEGASGWTNTGQITNASNLSFTISQGAEKKFRISGAAEPVGIDLVGYEVSGSLDFDYDNLDEYVEITGDKRGNLVIVFTDAGGAGVGTLDIDVVTFEAFPMDASPDELMTASIDFSANTVTYAT